MMKILFLIMIFPVTVLGESSLQPLSFDFSVKEGDCFAADAKVSMIIRINQILLRERKYNASLYFEKEKDVYIKHELGKVPWTTKKSIFWTKTSCPAKVVLK